MTTPENTPDYTRYTDDDLEGAITGEPDRAGVVPGADAEPEPSGIRTGTLVWGAIALLVALWSLTVTVLDWRLDPVIVLIGVGVLGGVALLTAGIMGARRNRVRP